MLWSSSRRAELLSCLLHRTTHCGRESNQATNHLRESDARLRYCRMFQMFWEGQGTRAVFVWFPLGFAEPGNPDVAFITADRQIGYRDQFRPISLSNWKLVAWTMQAGNPKRGLFRSNSVRSGPRIISAVSVKSCMHWSYKFQGLVYISVGMGSF
jgi:hypothetical protein